MDGARDALRRASIDNGQATNYLEAYKYDMAINNIETSIAHLQRAIDEIKKLPA